MKMGQITWLLQSTLGSTIALFYFCKCYNDISIVYIHTLHALYIKEIFWTPKF